MEISTRRMSKRSQEPVDQWLVKEGYFRKHIPRDPTCLFRAISEQVYLTQYYHIRVRKECIEFMRRMKHLFEHSITTPFDNYLEQMACFTEWGSINEIRAMSLLYKRDIIIFNGQKQTSELVTNNGFKDTISLCHTAPKQYETIYTMDFVQTAAYCQSIVYEVLYKEIFNMPNIATTVHKMLHDRSAAFRHDRFFLKGNLDIREQLTADLYHKVESEHNDMDEAQSDLRRIPPIPYKVAKALDPGIYRNTDFDIWHEMRREVKYAGWSRHNNNELQIGGKCLIQINYSDNSDNNNIYVNSVNYDANGNNGKVMQQKSKQENPCFCGYIQEMGTNEDPVLVFIEELGEKRIVPFAALKPLPSKKNKQSNWTPTNKKNALTESNRRWRKTYNATSRKRKDTINMANGIASSVSRNNVDKNNINSMNKANSECDGRNTELAKLDQRQASENYTVEKCSNYAPNQLPNNVPMAVILDNSQPVMTNNIVQEINEDKKNNTVFMKHNIDNNLVNKTARSVASNNFDNSIQNSYSTSHSKPKMMEENYCPPLTNNSQMNVGGNPNLVYVAPDGNSYPLLPYLPGNYGELNSDNQMDHLFASRFFYNLGLEYLRVNQSWNYAPMTFGSSHHGAQPVGVPSNSAVNINNVPYIQDEVARLANGMQNCSLTYNDGVCNNDGRNINTEPVVSKLSLSNANGVHNVKQQKQGLLKNSNGKDGLYQTTEKVKQNGNSNRANKARHQHNTREVVYAHPQHSNYQYGTAIPCNPGNAYAARKNDGHVQHLDPMLPQGAGTSNVSAACAPSYAPPTVFPAIPCYGNEIEPCCNPYYVANGNFLSFPCVPTQPDATENNGMSSYLPHLYPGTETYPLSYPAPLCPPIMFPPPMPYPVLPAAPNMQEHWYPMLGQPHYMQYAPAPPPISEPSCSGQNTTPNGSP